MFITQPNAIAVLEIGAGDGTPVHRETIRAPEIADAKALVAELDGRAVLRGRPLRLRLPESPPLRHAVAELERFVTRDDPAHRQTKISREVRVRLAGR